MIEELKRHFSPEFLNRLDETVIFNKLTRENAEKILSLLLDKVKKRIESAGVKITFDTNVAKSLSELNYERSFGARPLARLITTHIENPLSDKLLLGEIKENDTVLCHFTDCAQFEIIKEKSLS